jgi:hypothetical protein
MFSRQNPSKICDTKNRWTHLLWGSLYLKFCATLRVAMQRCIFAVYVCLLVQRCCCLISPSTMTLKPEKQHNAQRRALLYSPFVWSVAAAGRMRFITPRCTAMLALPSCLIMTVSAFRICYISHALQFYKLVRCAQHCSAM